MTAPAETAEVLGPRRKLWTREELHSLAQSGAVDLERIELIEGELYDTMDKNVPHVNAVRRLERILADIFGFDFVTPERPIDVAAADMALNEPEPDAVVLTRRYESFSSPPLPADIRLLVEVSDTTLNFDLRTKANVYARAEIQEYWVVDLNNRKLIVHREPGQGRHKSIVAYDATD